MTTNVIKEGRFEWDDEDIALTNRLTFSLNEELRLMVLDPKVTVTYSHYFKNNFGRVEVKRCSKLDGGSCKYCNEGSAFQPRFGTSVVVYRSLKPLIWEILPWIFGKDKFAKLKQLKKAGIDFYKSDLKVYCYNETFQNVKIEVIKGEALWNRIAELKKEIVETFKNDRPNILAMMIQGASELKAVGGRNVPPPTNESANSKLNSSGYKKKELYPKRNFQDKQNIQSADLDSEISSKNIERSLPIEEGSSDDLDDLDRAVEEIIGGTSK